VLKSTDQFMGFDGFVWFQGVVESRADPLFLGRLQVRILGIHTEDKTDIPTADLPWAYPVMPITSASMNGIGQTPVGAVEGTWVVGFFRDGESCQEPMILGTFGGYPQKTANKQEGFNDPYGTYPLSDYLKEPDTNRLARNQKLSETIVQKKKDAQIVDDIPVALERQQQRSTDEDTSWIEPDPAYAAVYPFNQVMQTQSGHIKEYDDTHGHTRIAEYHQLGTFYEVYEENGRANKLTKINGNNYKIVIQDDNLYVQGSINITTDARCNIYAGNDLNIEAQSNCNIVTMGNTFIDTKGNLEIQAVGDITIQAGGNLNINASNITATAAQNTHLHSVSGTAISSIAALTMISQGRAILASNLGTYVTSSAGPVMITSNDITTVSGPTLLLTSTLYTSVASDLLIKVGSKGLVDIMSSTGLVNITSSTGLVNITSPIQISMLSPKVFRPVKLTFDITPVV